MFALGAATRIYVAIGLRICALGSMVSGGRSAMCWNAILPAVIFFSSPIRAEIGFEVGIFRWFGSMGVFEAYGRRPGLLARTGRQ